MELLVKLFLTLLGICLFIGPLQYECRKLDGYKFPVYSTELCPRNQTEWNERSSAINCTENNGYLCFPNEKLTQLLEFCHKKQFIRIEEGSCLYLEKDDSAIYSYSCSSFQSGCHNTSFSSQDLFQHSSCTSIGNGCFLAEPSCKGPDTTTIHLETTKTTHVEIVTRNYSTTASTDEKTTQTLTYKDYVIYDEIFMMPIFAGVLIPIIIFCMLCIIYRKGYHISERKSDVESPGEEECKPLMPTTDMNKIHLVTNKEESPLDQAVFEQWQEDNTKFFPTRACKEVEKLIKSQNLVVVTGNSGSGKSAIIQHIALYHRSQGLTVKSVNSVKKILDACDRQNALDKRTLFVFDDPIGNGSFDEEKYKLWKDHEKKLKVCLKNIYLLVSCRRYILNDASVGGILKDTSCIIDLSNDQHKLDNEEKRTMLELYSLNSGLLKKDINKIIKIEEYFPLLCKLYSSDKNKRKGVLQFFEEPVKVCEKEINYFKRKCKENYCALVLLVLCNNQLCVQDIRENEKFQLALQLCEMTNTAPPTIGDALKTLEGYFVKKISDTYHFYHDLVMEVTTYVFGTDYPRETIQHADIGLLRRRVNLESSNDQKKEVKLENGDHKNDKCIIYLKDRFVSDLVDRLFVEIFGDRLLEVVLNPCMRNEKIAKLFIEKLNKNLDQLRKLVEKIDIQNAYKEVDREQKDSLNSFTKLDFLCSKDEVSILSAIIVFCHTDLSKYCLKILLQMNFPLEDIFPAVCCNGSIDLFNALPEDFINEFKMEPWGSLYPIHIVTLFCHHELLHKLIKNDMNLNLEDKGGDTPLMLAAFHKEDQANKITVELLLNNGADINLCHPTFGSALHGASAAGNHCIAELLLNKGANISSFKNFPKNSALHYASENGHESTVQLLLDKGADIESCNKDKETPLHKASESGHDSTVQLLLDKGAVINSCNKQKETPLHKASKNGHNSTVQLLLDKGADINSCDINKGTPLHQAIEGGRDSTVQFLLDKRVNINVCDDHNVTPLYRASQYGHESTVKLLIDKGADINAYDICNKTTLHIASKYYQYKNVEILLRSGADVNFCDERNRTPLHKASRYGHDSIVQLLLSNGADINSFDKNGETPLHKACENGSDSTVQLLLSNGANIYSCDKRGETPLNKAITKRSDSNVNLSLRKRTDVILYHLFGETLLHKACKKGQESTMLCLLKKGADINVFDKYGKTPLHEASENGYKTTVHLLLKYGADVNICDQFQETPLHKASRVGHDCIVQLLLTYGANVNSCDRFKETPLHKASKKGHDKTVQILLNNEADNNSCDRFEETPFHKACQKGHGRTVQLLLRKGEASINSCNRFKETPLHSACKNGHESKKQFLQRREANVNFCKDTTLQKAFEKRHFIIVQLLLSHGAEINPCDKKEETPLHIASKNGYESIVELLLSFGANVNLCDVDKNTALHKASEKGYENIVQLLLSGGANVNSCDEDQKTPLYKASKEGHERIVQLLLSGGANVNLCGDCGKTPLQNASEKGHKGIVELLLNEGANFNLCNDDGKTALNIASEEGHESIVQLLLSEGANINSGCDYRETSLHRACVKGHESIVQILISEEADINLSDKFGATPLHRACENGHERIVHILLCKGAKVDVCDDEEETPLDKAILYGYKSISQFLFSNGANTNLCYDGEETPLNEEIENEN